MPIAAGTKVGPYEVVSVLGAGGMGEVYQAWDSRLGREVALKVLPEALAGDPERLSRLEREAQTLAALNHPNIAQIYALELLPIEVEGKPRRLTLVMERVEGQTLAELLEKGPLPLDEVISIGRQIAEGLEAAHERGIVHRDLKPGNIKVTPKGIVKVLDFGLARAFGRDSASDSSLTSTADSPTLVSHPMTAAGVILGTAAYMAPEQAKGKVVDRRADIWSFGCVLAEMLSGRPLFTGETFSDVLAAVILKEPDLGALPKNVPQTLKHLLVRCLDKDPKRRLRDIGEARILLENPLTPEAETAEPKLRGRFTGFPLSMLGWGVALLAVIGLAVTGWYARQPPEPGLSKSHVALQVNGGEVIAPALSPDGRRVVFESRSRLWVQSLDEWEARELPGTEEGRFPFWSPQSDWIGFFRDNYLLRVPALGGAVVTLCLLPTPQSPFLAGTWTEEGSVLFTPGFGPLYEVSALGGEPREAFSIPDGYDDFHDIQNLPGGAGLLVVAHRSGGGVDTLGVLSASGFTVVTQFPGARIGRAVYSPTGHIVYTRIGANEGIWALPFSLSSRTSEGEPWIITPGRWPSVSDDGTLAFTATSTAPPRHLAWFSREGSIIGILASARPWREGLSISADGRKVAAADADGIWAYDAVTGSRSRLTVGDQDSSPVWIGPRGDRLAFIRTTDRETALMIQSAGGSQDAREIVRHARAPTASADGRYLAFNLLRIRSPQSEGLPSPRVGTPWEPAWVDLQESEEVHRLGNAHIGGRFPEISPDGRFLAYVSNETGRDEVFLTQFPSGQGKWQVSIDGGGWLKWSPTGDEIIYRSRGREMMAVPVNLGEIVKIGIPRVLFEWDGTWANYYSFAPDSRILTAVPVEKVREVPSIRLVRNWLAEFSNPR